MSPGLITIDIFFIIIIWRYDYNLIEYKFTITSLRTLNQDRVGGSIKLLTEHALPSYFRHLYWRTHVIVAVCLHMFQTVQTRHFFLF